MGLSSNKHHNGGLSPYRSHWGCHWEEAPAATQGVDWDDCWSQLLLIPAAQYQNIDEMYSIQIRDPRMNRLNRSKYLEYGPVSMLEGRNYQVLTSKDFRWSWHLFMRSPLWKVSERPRMQSEWRCSSDHKYRASRPTRTGVEKLTMRGCACGCCHLHMFHISPSAQQAEPQTKFSRLQNAMKMAKICGTAFQGQASHLDDFINAMIPASAPRTIPPQTVGHWNPTHEPKAPGWTAPVFRCLWSWTWSSRWTGSDRRATGWSTAVLTKPGDTFGQKIEKSGLTAVAVYPWQDTL